MDGRNRQRFRHGSRHQAAPLLGQLANHFTSEDGASNEKPMMESQESMLSTTRHTNTAVQHNMDRGNDSEEYAQFLLQRLANLRAARAQVEQMVMTEHPDNSDGTTPADTEICPCGYNGAHDGHWYEDDVPLESPGPTQPTISFDNAARYYWANRYLTDQLIQRDYTYVENHNSPRNERAASFNPSVSAVVESESHSSRRRAALARFARSDDPEGSTRTKFSNSSEITGSRIQTQGDKSFSGNANNSSNQGCLRSYPRSSPSRTGSPHTSTTQPARLERTTSIHGAPERCISPAITKTVSWDELPEHDSGGSLIRDEASWVSTTMPSLSPRTSALHSARRHDEDWTKRENDDAYRNTEDIQDVNDPIFCPPQLVPQCAPQRVPHRPCLMRDVDNIHVARHTMSRGASSPPTLRSAPPSTRAVTTAVQRGPSAPPVCTARKWRRETTAGGRATECHYELVEALPHAARRELRAGAATNIYRGNMPMPTVNGMRCVRALEPPQRVHIQSALPSLADIHAAPPQAPQLHHASPRIQAQLHHASPRIQAPCERCYYTSAHATHAIATAPTEVHVISDPTLSGASSQYPAYGQCMRSEIVGDLRQAHPAHTAHTAHPAHPAHPARMRRVRKEYHRSASCAPAEIHHYDSSVIANIHPRGSSLPAEVRHYAPAVPGRAHHAHRAHPAYSNIQASGPTPLQCQTCAEAPPAASHVMSSAPMRCQIRSGAPPADLHVVSSAATSGQTRSGVSSANVHAMSSTPATCRTRSGVPSTNVHTIASAQMPCQRVHTDTNTVPNTDVFYMVSPPHDNDVVPHVITHSSNQRSTIHPKPTRPGTTTLLDPSPCAGRPNTASSQQVAPRHRHHTGADNVSASPCKFAPLSSQNPPPLQGSRSSYTCCPPTIRACIVHLRTVPVSPVQLRQLRHEVAVAIEWSVRREHSGVKVTCVDFRHDGVGMRGVYTITPAICRRTWDAIMADKSTPIHCLLDLLEPVQALENVPVQ